MDTFAPKFHRLREYCVKWVTPPCMDHDVQYESMKKYPNKARGSDNQSAKEFIGYPRICREAQCSAMQEAYNLFVVPHQLLLTLSACMGKPGGGTRTIGLTPMWHRCFGKFDTTVSDWEATHTQPYDKAGKGKSALTTASLLNLKAEVAMVLGMSLVSAFHDVKKFFDSIDLDILLEAVMREDFPKGTFVLAIAQHLAPRLLMLSGFVGTPKMLHHLFGLVVLWLLPLLEFIIWKSSLKLRMITLRLTLTCI